MTVNLAINKNCCHFAAMALAGFLSLNLSACVDLKAVQKFSETAALTASYEDTTNTFANYYERTGVFHTEKSKPSQDMIENRRAAAEGLRSIQKIVSEYMQTLGKLASDDLTNTNDELGALNKAMKALPGLSSESSDAASASLDFAAKFTDILLKGWRSHELGEIIKGTNESFQNAIYKTRAMITKTLKKSLCDEEKLVNAYFDLAESEANGVEAIARLVEYIRENRLKEIDENISKLVKLDKILENIASSHEMMASHYLDLSAKELASALLRNGKELAELYKAATAINP